MTVRELAEDIAPPTIYDVVPIETKKQCQMYTGERPKRCENTAKYLFVYDQNVQDLGQPSNCLACAECVPEENHD